MRTIGLTGGELFACCPLADRKKLEKAGNVRLDRLFDKVNLYNVGNNRGGTVLVHLAITSNLLQQGCREKFVGKASHVVYDGNQGRGNKKPGFKCHFCTIKGWENAKKRRATEKARAKDTTPQNENRIKK